MKNRLDRSKFFLGTYILQPYARTEAHIKDLADAGIDVVMCMQSDYKALDLFAKYGVGAIVNDVLPGWWGGDGDRAGTMHKINTWDKYEAGAAKFVDHPAIVGIDTGDEPSALDFPYYGRVMDFTEKHFPGQFAYLNLYPNYASVSQNNATETVNQLGTPTYAEHIAEYCKHVGTDYICYDFYMYSASVAGAYENLRIVADAARDTGRSMWIVLQVNSNKPAVWITENQLRFQAYTAMAFGTESIIWACWTAGWWHNQVVDANGEKTQQYEKLKTVNHEIKGFADTYMKYRRTSTHFIGFGENHPDLAKLAYEPKESLSTGIFFDVTAPQPIVVGQMVAKNPDDGYALMIAAADDAQDVDPKSYEVTFRAYDRVVTVYRGNTAEVLLPDADGVYHVPMTSCAGALITAK